MEIQSQAEASRYTLSNNDRSHLHCIFGKFYALGIIIASDTFVFFVCLFWLLMPSFEVVAAV